MTTGTLANAESFSVPPTREHAAKVITATFSIENLSQARETEARAKEKEVRAKERGLAGALKERARKVKINLDYWKTRVPQGIPCLEKRQN